MLPIVAGQRGMSFCFCTAAFMIVLRYSTTALALRCWSAANPVRPPFIAGCLCHAPTKSTEATMYLRSYFYKFQISICVMISEKCTTGQEGGEIGVAADKDAWDGEPAYCSCPGLVAWPLCE